MALLEYAGIPKATYYYHTQKRFKPDKHKDLKKKIREIFNEHHQRYGYRRIALELRNQGSPANHKLVLKLMHEMDLRCKVRRKKYKSYQGDVGKVALNIIERNFRADAPNYKWTTDVSEFSIACGQLYLSPILDMFNGEIISFDIGKSPNLQQVTSMLDSALHRCTNRGELILHSDQGWQYQNRIFQKQLENAGIIQSMSRKGNCLDNAIMENFFGIMKTEMFHGCEKTFRTLEELELAINEYIDDYNNRRIKLRKGLLCATDDFSAL